MVVIRIFSKNLFPDRIGVDCRCPAPTESGQRQPVALTDATAVLRWPADAQALSDLPSELAPELPGFKRHRHDQVLPPLPLRAPPRPGRGEAGFGFWPPLRTCSLSLSLDRKSVV